MKFLGTVYGPPGTGKTTYGIDWVCKMHAKGIPLESIGYVAFTKKAANEARMRILNEGVAPYPKALNNFRTIHSFCYREMGLHSTQIMSAEKLRLFSKETQFYIRPSLIGDQSNDTFSELPEGNIYLFVYNLARNRLCEPMEVFEQDKFQNDARLSAYELEQFIKAYDSFKFRYALFVFTDMLEKYAAEYKPPVGLTALFVDEAQDLSKLQWKTIGRMSQNVEYMVVAGDDDQAIYEWAGSDTETFVKLGKRADKSKVLAFSHRLPKKIKDLASKVISRVPRRVEKDFVARDCEGSIYEVSSLDEVPLDKGEFLILCRHRYQMKELIEDLKAGGWSCDCPPYSPLGTTAFKNYALWTKMKQGGHLGDNEVKSLYKMVNMGNHGVRVNSIEYQHISACIKANESLIWESSVDSDDLTHIKSIIANEDPLYWTKPRITVSTIHGAKGAECPNVVLYQDVSTAVAESLDTEEGFASETKVFYVGITRAKYTIWLMILATPNSYPIIGG